MSHFSYSEHPSIIQGVVVRLGHISEQEDLGGALIDLSADETDIEIVDAPLVQVKQERAGATQSASSAKQLIENAIAAVPEHQHTHSRNSHNSLVSTTPELLANNSAFMKSIQHSTEWKLEFLERREAREKDEMVL